MTLLQRLLLVMVVAIPLSSVTAQQPLVRMRLEPLSLRSRSSGPIGIQVKLEYNKEQLLEGNLLLKVYDGPRNHGMLLTTLRYDGIVLQGADTIFNMQLPPLADTGYGSIDIEAWFETATQRIPLSAGSKITDLPDTFSVMSSALTQHTVVLCSTSGRTDPASVTVQRSQLHDMLSPKPLVLEKQRKALVWFSSPRAGHSMPEDPLALCSYDMVLLTDGSLNKLEAGQLEALTTWTKAGGSLCIAPTEQGLASRHLEFLSQLFPNDSNRLLLSDDGQITFVSGEATICAAYTGLGRSVLLPHGIDPVADLPKDEQAWIREFLWKARNSSWPKAGEDFADAHRRRPPVAEPTPNNLQGAIGQPGYVDPYGNWRASQPFSTQATGFGQLCQSILMPSDVQMVPTTVIVGLLLAYVLAVGPIDYCVLGWLRIRKYTWIVFPLVTLGFTLMMVAVAHRYLGSNETGGRLTVTDVVDDGRPIRSSAIDLLFVGTRKDTTSAIKAGLLTSIQSQQTLTQPSAQLNFTGRFPHDYSVSRRIEQWTPEMTRTLTLSPDAIPDLAFDWSDVSLVTTKEGREKLKATLTNNSETECIRVAVLHGIDGHGILGGAVSPFREYTNSDHHQNAAYRNALRQRTSRQIGEVGSRAPLQGLFQYFSQVSPGGAAAMEDIPIMDPGNPDQWLLVILLKTDDGYHLIRKLYCVTEPSE
jgi:hypothetical protein